MESDRDAVRFLWLTGPPSGEKEGELRVLRMTRVVFGASPSPFLLAATIRKHLRRYEIEQPHVVETLREAYHVTTIAMQILSTAGMDLCN